MTNVEKKYAKTVAIVNYWPDIDNAETECVSRIESALLDLNVECIPINRHGFLIEDSLTHVDEMCVDFVLALHFDSAKCWSAFTYYALWNPLDFYFQWSYRDKSRNIISHDAFLSCGSVVADDHIKRLLNGVGRADNESFLTLYHGTHKPILEPAIGENKLFYCGINWEAISGNGGRHHELLKILDAKGYVDIYGPKVFQGVEVWKGYESYQGSIPFDGMTLIKKVAQSGIGLVLSSEAHIRSGLMSSRLFESLAAGVPIICDGNPFAKKNFGDLLLYVDTKKQPIEIADQIETHVEWIKQNPEEALGMAKKAQDIYLEKFELLKNLRVILESGKHNKITPKNHTISLASFFIADKCDHIFFRKIKNYVRHFTNGENIKPVVVLPDTTSRSSAAELQELHESMHIIFYKRVNLQREKNAINSLNAIIDFSLELSPDVNLQVIQPYEYPSWEAIAELWSQLNDNKDMELAWGGFTVKSNTINPAQGKANFVPEILTANLFDPNYAFSSASCIFKNKYLFSVNALLKYIPFFAFRMLYINALATKKIIKIANVSSTLDFDEYSTLFRVDESDAVFREVEFFTDYLGEEYIKSHLSKSDRPVALMDTSKFIRELDKNAARELIEKLFMSIKIPKIFQKITTWMWKKNAL